MNYVFCVVVVVVVAVAVLIDFLFFILVASEKNLFEATNRLLLS